MKKLGRNKPCPCGSGRKFKKCCQFKARQLLIGMKLKLRDALNGPMSQGGGNDSKS